MQFSFSSVGRVIPFFVRKGCTFFIYYFYYKCSVYLSKMLSKKLTKKQLKTVLCFCETVWSAVILAVKYAFW